MNIGILTLPLHTNYGGILQAYALQTIINEFGHNTILINKKRYLKLALWKYPYSFPKRFINKYIFRKNITILYERKKNKEYQLLSANTQSFINKNIRHKNVNNLYSLKSNDFDLIIVGSDQIWRPLYYPNIENAFLDFTEKWNIKRIAYAVSFGTDKWEYNISQTEICAKMAKKFDNISVREISGIELCRKYLGIKATHVLDPTILLKKEHYIQLFEKENTPQSNGNLLCYILDENEEKKDIIKYVADKLSLTPFYVNANTENKNLPIEYRIQPPVECWLRGFYDAKIVITDSYHACIFSIIFNKDFWVIGNKERGLTRFSSLLKTFDLEDRMIMNLTATQHIIKNSINWSKVNTILDTKRTESYNFLKYNLSND